MNNDLLYALKCSLKKCSDCLLHPDYVSCLKKLYDIELSQEYIDYLCKIITSKKYIWEIRLDHLAILLLNPSAKAFDLKDFYFENTKKCRRLAMKIFYIRGYAIYASEKELSPVMEKFCRNLEKNHDYIDYNYILSVAGLPYLVNLYKYDCFAQALKKAEEEHEKIDPLLRGYFTINSDIEQVSLLTVEETKKRLKQFLDKHKDSL